MIACQWTKTQVLVEAQVRTKLSALDSALEALLKGGTQDLPEQPGRDVQILPIRDLPAKRGFSFKEGQARLLHDLASIELQAMELGVRTLIEFPDAPVEFREQLAHITAEEGRHLELCLDAMEDLELPWGSFPTHLGLWESVSASDSILDRLAIVHRYLEGSGLDASDTILRRLSGVNAPVAERAVRVIRRDEMAHVQFGSFWYHELARQQGLDPGFDFCCRLEKLFHRIPRRLEPVAASTRLQAGFTNEEIEGLQKLRLRWLNGEDRIHPKA